MPKSLKSPYPWFGGKSQVMHAVWARFGRVDNFVDPFCGSLASILCRPMPVQGRGIETVNDLNGYVANFWRAIRADPGAVAAAADWPVNENDLHARHVWLVGRHKSLVAKLEGDPDYYSAKAAGWWVWGISCWIAAGWCAGNGPWKSVAGKLVKDVTDGTGVARSLPHLGDGGMGVNRKRPHLGNDGMGVHRNVAVGEWFGVLSDRMRSVRVCCGDWQRVCGPTPTNKLGRTAVFLDPPYADTAGRAADLYAHDFLQVAHAARVWAIERGSDPDMRIALCGYEGEHKMPADWECLAWKARGGFAGQSAEENINAKRERIWFSPHCVKPKKEGFGL